jgi:preprotein translocase subunit SecE
MKIPGLRFLGEVRSEFIKVTWPTRNQTIKLTIIVIAVSAVVSMYAFGLDLMFEQILKTVLSK